MQPASQSWFYNLLGEASQMGTPSEVATSTWSMVYIQGWPKPYINPFIHSVCTVFLIRESPYIRARTVFFKGCGQPLNVPSGSSTL